MSQSTSMRPRYGSRRSRYERPAHPVADPRHRAPPRHGALPARRDDGGARAAHRPPAGHRGPAAGDARGRRLRRARRAGLEHRPRARAARAARRARARARAHRTARAGRAGRRREGVGDARASRAAARASSWSRRPTGRACSGSPTGTAGRIDELHASAAGKLLLAELDDRAVAGWIRRVKPRRLTARTITAPGALREELARVRERGWAEIDGESEPAWPPSRCRSGRRAASSSPCSATAGRPGGSSAGARRAAPGGRITAGLMRP